LGFSIFETKAEGNGKQRKIFLDIPNSKPKIASKANQRWKTKEPNRETTEIFLVFLCFGKVEIRTRTLEKVKHEYTKVQQNIICR
jgi:hypothetical protein